MLWIVWKNAASATRFWRTARLTGDELAPAARHARLARVRIWCVAMLGWACATSAHAAESGYGVGVSLTYDSNIGRVETSPQGNWTRGLIGNLFYRENTTDLTARVDAQVERRHYYGNSFNDDSVGFMDGAGVWTILPRQLKWTVEDTFRMLQINLTVPNTPSNLTQSNTLSTGPDYTLSMSSTNTAVIGARYGRFDIKNDPHDNQRYTGYLRGVHALSAQAKVSLNYEVTHLYFEPGATPFSKVFREDLYGRFENLSRVNSTTLDLGTSWVTQYGIGGAPVAKCEATTTPSPPPCSATSSLGPNGFARLTFLETLSSQSTVRIMYSQQISDTFTDLLIGVVGSTAPREPPIALPVLPTFVSGDLYRSQRGELAYANNDGRFLYTLQAYGRRVDFDTSTQDDFEETGGTFVWGWIFSDAAKFSALALSNRRTYTNIDRRDADRAYSVRWTYKVNTNINAGVYVERIERRSTVPLSSYVDNRLVLTLGYIASIFGLRP